LSGTTEEKLLLAATTQSLVVRNLEQLAASLGATRLCWLPRLARSKDFEKNILALFVPQLHFPVEQRGILHLQHYIITCKAVVLFICV